MTLQNVVQRSVLTALPNSFVQAIIILGHCQLVIVSILIVCTESNNGSPPPVLLYIWLHTRVFCCYFQGQGMVVASHRVLYSLRKSSPCWLPKPLHLVVKEKWGEA